MYKLHGFKRIIQIYINYVYILLMNKNNMFEVKTKLPLYLASSHKN